MRSWRSCWVLVGLVTIAVVVGWQHGLSQPPRYETRIVVLKSKANLAAVFGNRPAVKRVLMRTAEQSQRELIPQLETWRQQGEVRRYRRFWIINAIAVEGTERVFDALRQHPTRAPRTHACHTSQTKSHNGLFCFSTSREACQASKGGQ